MKSELVFSVVAVSIFALAYGCSDDDHSHDTGEEGGHSSPYPSCQAIIDACHPKDIGEGAAHDCHEIAHDNGTEEKCAAAKSQCLVTCGTVQGLPDGGADAGDGGST